jgi:two-component system response regulator DevR
MAVGTPGSASSPAPDHPVGVFIVDDLELLRLGIAALLAVERDVRVVGEAGRAADALARIRATRPEVVLIDVHLPDGDGVDLCRAIRAEPVPAACLMLAATPGEEALAEAIDAGAAGYVLKSVHGAELVRAVRTVASGGRLAGARARLGAPEVRERMQGVAVKLDPLKDLGETDREIVTLIGLGLTNRQIGDRMGLSERTIKNHVSHVLAVLELERRTQVAVLAASLKWTA